MSKRHRGICSKSSRSQQENFGASTAKYPELLHNQVDSGAVIDWEFLRKQGLEQDFLRSFQTNGFTCPQWKRLFRIQEPVYIELIREFFSTFHFDLAEESNDVGDTTILFRLGVSIGVARLQSLVGGYGCIVNMRPLREGLCVCF